MSSTSSGVRLRTSPLPFDMGALLDHGAPGTAQYHRRSPRVRSVDVAAAGWRCADTSLFMMAT